MTKDSLPDIRFTAIADALEPFAVDAAKRFGYARAETSWQAIVDAPDIDVVSVAIANELHRPVVEALLAPGKHVLCENSLAPSVEDAKAMVAAAERAQLGPRPPQHGDPGGRHHALNGGQAVTFA